MIFNLGAPSQLDTWDMKPDAPREIRGPFKPIRTNNPDIQISEIFPLHRQVGGQIFARAHLLSHRGRGSRYRPSDDANRPALHRRDQYASCRLRSQFLAGRRNDLPAHVILPEPMGPTGGNLPHGQDAGFLGKAYDPFVLNADPSQEEFSRCPTCCRPAEIGEARLQRRQALRAGGRRDRERLRSQPERAIDGRQLRLGLPLDDERQRRGRRLT